MRNYVLSVPHVKWTGICRQGRNTMSKTLIQNGAYMAAVFAEAANDAA